MPTEANPNDRGSFAAWVFWMIAQWMVLAAFAMRVRLAANFPLPVENHALIAVTVTQLLLASGLMTLLVPDLRRVLLALGGAWPMLVLAGLLAGADTATILATGLLVSIWLITMASLSGIRSRGLAGVVQAGLVLISTGTPILVYFIHEFARSTIPVRWIGYFSPTVGCASTSLHGVATWGNAIFPLLVILLRQVFHNRASRLH